MCTFCLKLLKFLTDEIYRVPLRSDGGFESEYINASFVNVSYAYYITLKVTAAHSVQGLQAEECLHSNSGSTEGDSGGLLEDGVGLPVWLYCDALSVGRRWPGL